MKEGIEKGVTAYKKRVAEIKRVAKTKGVFHFT